MVWLFKCGRSKELWDGDNSFPFIQDGPVYPLLKEAPSPLAFRVFEEFVSWLTLYTFGPFHSVGNQKIGPQPWIISQTQPVKYDIGQKTEP